MSEKKRRWSKKSAAVVAFAASLLASNAASVLSAAEETPGDLGGNTMFDSEHTGDDVVYKALAENVYKLQNRSEKVEDYYSLLNKVNDFGLFAVTTTTNHLECNAAVESINEFNLQYTNIVRHNSIGTGKYIVYLGAAPTSAQRLDMASIPADAEVEVVLNFGFEREDTDNGNRVGFNTNGVHYELLNVKASNVTIRTPEPGETQFNISGTLDNLADSGSKLIKDVGGVKGTTSFRAALESAYQNISDGTVQPGETLIITADANDVAYKQDYENALVKVLTQNNGVSVIINVDTAEFDGNYFNLGNINGTTFNKGCANVVWNFGNYDGNLSAPAGGIVVAPAATVTTDKGHVNGALICREFNQNNEIHQVTRPSYPEPDEDPSTEESSEESSEESTEEKSTEETTDEPDVPTTDEPDVPTTDEPDVPTTDEPDVPTTDEPDVPTTDEPVVPTTDESSEETTEETTEETDEPSVPDTPVNPPHPDDSDKPVTPDEPDKPVTPDEPDKPVTPDEPDKPVTPDEPDKPVTPDEPDKPVTPDDPDKPVTPDEPVKPITPGRPSRPTTPDEPTTPVTPEKPIKPESPESPENPEKPVTPVTPKKPEESGEAEDPDDPDEPADDVEPTYDDSEEADTDSDVDDADPEEIEFLPDDVPLGEIPVDYDPNNPIHDDTIIEDIGVPMGENPNMGVEGPVGAGIAAVGAAVALAVASKKRKK